MRMTGYISMILNILILVCGLFSLCSCGEGQSLFKSNSKKGPNIYSSIGPSYQYKSRSYWHSVSKKKTKHKSNKFSDKKKRFGSAVSGSKGGKGNGGRIMSGGRKK